MAGTLSYSHLLTANIGGTYGYTVADILPISLNPTVVATNVGVGIAQKALTIGSVNFYIPASVGPTITGSNIGWNWTWGGLADIPIKKAGVPTAWGIEPNIRTLSATVNGVQGSQIIFGINIRFAQ